MIQSKLFLRIKAVRDTISEISAKLQDASYEQLAEYQQRCLELLLVEATLLVRADPEDLRQYLRDLIWFNNSTIIKGNDTNDPSVKQAMRERTKQTCAQEKQRQCFLSQFLLAHERRHAS